MDKFEQLISKKKDQLDKLYATLEATKQKIKNTEAEIEKIKAEKEAEKFVEFKKVLTEKCYDVDAILNAIKSGEIDVSSYKNQEENK